MERIKFVFTAVTTAVTYLFGGVDTLLAILLVFIAIDFISGFVKAWALKEFESSKFYIGGVKKIGILLIVAVAAQLDLLIAVDNMALRTIAVSYYIANEGFSILENWGEMGLPLPGALKNALAKLRKDDDNGK